MTVYVKWYGKVLEGEYFEEEAFPKARNAKMKQMVCVKIPVQGVSIKAAFRPSHVYASKIYAEQATGISEKSQLIAKNPQELPVKEQIPAMSDVLPVDDREMIETFKRENWDQERNHLRIDKLDEFYQLWRMAMRPFGFVDEAEAPKEQKTKKKCENCSCFVFTTTLGSPEKPEWHCKHGFLPSNDCQEQAAYNDECMMKDPAQRSAGWKPDPITKGYSEITSPYPAITQPYSGKSQEPTKKMLRSTGVQQFKDSTQLALFE